MPANRIRGEYQELAQIAQSFGTQADKLNTAFQRLKASQATLENGDWIGVGAQKFYEEMNAQVQPALQRLVRALQQAQQVTQEISQVIKQAEDDAAAVFKLTGDGPGAPDAKPGGALAGAAIGGILGSILAPGIGSVAGAALGAVVGNVVSNMLGGKTYIDKTESVEVLEKAYGSYATITEGKVEVLAQADFEKAYDKIYGGTEYAWDTYVKPKFGNLEGFAHEGTNYINQDSVSVDTVPHEMLHSNTHANFSTFAEGNLNEGATEYLTIKAVTAAGYTPTHSYPNQEGVVQELVAVVGEEKLLNAYFKGETDALKTAMEANCKGSWADFKAAMDAEDWTKAKALLVKK